MNTDEDSDCSVDGYDQTHGNWVTVKKRKTNICHLKQCSKIITGKDEGVQCNVCYKWYHAFCQALSPGALNALKKFKGLAWICEACADELKSGKSAVLNPCKNSATDKRLDQLLCTVTQQGNKIDSLTTCYEQLCSEILSSQKNLMEAIQVPVKEGGGNEKQGVMKATFADIVKGSCEEVVTRITSKIEAMPQGAGEESVEKEKRRCNVVVHNLPESEAGSSKDCSEKDIIKFMSIIRDELHIHARVISSFRVGQKHRVKPRLLIVKFETETAKWDVVRNARHLQHSQRWGNIYINPDLTKNEREAANQLRQELDRRRESGEKDLAIRNKRILQVEGTDEKYRDRLATRKEGLKCTEEKKSEVRNHPGREAVGEGSVARLAYQEPNENRTARIVQSADSATSTKSAPPTQTRSGTDCETSVPTRPSTDC